MSLALSLVELFYLFVKAVKECMARRQDYTVTPVTPPLTGRNAYKNQDELIDPKLCEPGIRDGRAEAQGGCERRGEERDGREQKNRAGFYLKPGANEK